MRGPGLSNACTAQMAPDRNAGLGNSDRSCPECLRTFPSILLSPESIRQPRGLGSGPCGSAVAERLAAASARGPGRGAAGHGASPAQENWSPGVPRQLGLHDATLGPVHKVRICKVPHRQSHCGG